jgi:hypothetical protein
MTKDEKISALFRQILQNDLIVDANAPADKNRFRLVFRHCQQWAIDDNSIEVSHITTSESHGYGMLMLVVMAGREEALDFAPGQWICGCGCLQDYFNAMLRTVQAFPSVVGKDNRLFAWELFGYPKEGDNRTGYRQEDGYKTAPFIRDPESGDCATDGDMDIIYALLLADKQWGSGAVDYKQIALLMLESLWDYCVHKEYHTLLLGDWARGRPGPLGSAVRVSDIIPGHIKAYAEADKAHDWRKVSDAVYGVIGDLYEGKETQNGLLPDFAVRTDGKWKAPEGKILEGDDGAYSYNACRVPWRLGSDYLLYGDTAIGNSSLYEMAIRPLNAFAKAYTGGDLDRLGPLTLNGVPLEGPDPAVFAAPFLVTAAAASEEYPDWLDTVWRWPGMERYNGDNYGDYLKLLSMLAASLSAISSSSSSPHPTP